MRKFPLLFFCAILSNCTSMRFVSPYDEVLDKGVTEFAEQLNTHVKNMANLGGKPEGTFDANVSTYNALSSKLDLLIDRAATESSGSGCKLEGKIMEKVKKRFGGAIPPELTGVASASGSGCSERLLENVKTQLQAIEDIHKSIDKCPDAKGISCLRAATAKSALDITNQSIRAVLVVEDAKRKGED